MLKWNSEKENLAFLRNRCKLKSILALPSLAPAYGIVVALKAALDKRNHSMLIHCNKGKVQRWSFQAQVLMNTFRFSATNPLILDQQFIELLKTERVTEEESMT
ncbi:hypothetical protein PsorP6_009605 [Peronosclerospora sorghi]|uniref:Uncharacterized protein n=1 Tax=Peronosclerospora sorghi TaxID=230839 RepID=A0ACC0VXL9_9STRA|nr:hypothetical protein PsorP6_009605 [Peronosclerospora sorghi]